MSVEFLQTLSLVSYICAGSFFLVTVALFFLLRVPKLISDITGISAKKAIESIRQQNESTGDKAYKPSAVNISRGKVTEKISPSGRLVPHPLGIPISGQTERFNTEELTKQTNSTTILSAKAETILLSGGSANGFAGLGYSDSGQTTILSPEQMSPMPPQKQPAVAAHITVEMELGFCGSTKLIE